MPVDYSYYRGVDIPADPEWLAPHFPEYLWGDLTRLLERLPVRQRIICALTACEMLGPLAYEVLSTLGLREERPGAHAAYIFDKAQIAAFEGRLVNNTFLAALLYHLERANTEAYGAGRGNVEFFVVNAFLGLVVLITTGEDPATEGGGSDLLTADVVGSCAIAVGHLAAEEWAQDPTARRPSSRYQVSQQARSDFLDAWWARCRARLAFRDAPVAVLEGYRLR